jgi:hypothetical protein
MKNTIFYNYVRWHDNKNVIKMLNNYPEIDLIYDGGIYFQIAIKHDNKELLNTLFEHFEKIQLKEKEADSIDYKLLKYELRKILEEAVDSFEISEEMEKVLVPYLPQEEEDYQLAINDLLVTEDNYNPDYETFETVKIGEHHENPDQILI